MDVQDHIKEEKNAHLPNHEEPALEGEKPIDKMLRNTHELVFHGMIAVFSQNVIHVFPLPTKDPQQKHITIV